MHDGSGVNSNDLLSALVQPDKTTGLLPTGANLAAASTTYTDNALGDVATLTDGNGNVHAYAYDVLGRRISDAVTTLGTGVDGAVRRITTAYDAQGNPRRKKGSGAEKSCMSEIKNGS